MSHPLLPRLRPDPIPALHPLPEYLVDGERAAADAPLSEIVAMARLFQWLLPGLLTNVAFLRAQLA